MRINFRKAAAYGCAVWIAAIFLDSLRFKFTGHPTPEHIFTTLRDWSGVGLFYPAGPWVIGSAELAAALLMLAAPVGAMIMARGNASRIAALGQTSGGLIAVGVMTGAIGFHLFTPLGIETPTAWADGEIAATSPALFIAACLTWVAGLAVVALRGPEAMAALKRDAGEAA